jgi:integrase
MPARRRFGKVRKLPSGRYQASYLDPEGIRRPAPETFRTKREAEQWLSLVETELLRGQWTNPDDRRELLRDFGNQWIIERPGLRPRTLDLYRWTFKKHVEPYLGNVPLGEIDPARVRRWRAKLLDSGVSLTMAAKAYRLLRAILMTAVDDGVLTRNPCRIRGGGTEPTPERPVLSVAQIFELAEKVPDRYTVLVLVAAFGSLRWSEATALRRRDVSIKSGVIRVERAHVERSSGEVIIGPPKSEAGKRSIALPRPVVLLLAVHLKTNVAEDPESLIFTGEKGASLRRSNFNKQANWKNNVAAIGFPALHFHDLRHTGNTLASDSGASLRDLMARMGHDSMQAALIYQHRSRGADRRIATAMEAMIDGKDDADAEDDDSDDDDGQAGALVPSN